MNAMDEASADTIAAPAEPAPDPTMAALLGALGGGAADPLAMIMSQLGAANPQAAMVMQLLEQRRAQSQAAAIEDAEIIREEETPAAPAIGAQELLTLRETLEKTYAELEVLRTRNDALARALGACYLCFGADPLCAECGGRGHAGALVPEPATFRQYVLPAVQRARAVDAHCPPPRKRPPHPSAPDA